MKKVLSLAIVVLLLLGLTPTVKFASARYGEKIIDGYLSDWTSSDLVVESKNIYTSAFKGADLYRLYVAWDGQYLYIAIETNNTESWSTNYGIGIDTDPGTGNGYTFVDQDGNSTTPEDLWWKRVAFGNGYAIDYEIYFWYDAENDRIGGGEFGSWTGNGWVKNDVNNVFQYAQISRRGLQVLEMAIPWSALGGKPEKIAIIAWVIDTEYGGNSPVDSVPLDPAVGDSITNPNNPWDEKTDVDTFTNLAEIYIGTKTIDGNLDDWTEVELVAESLNIHTNAFVGADLYRLYVSWDENYLYIAIKTNNSGNWDVFYGIGIDIDPRSGNGYTGTSDSWGQQVNFGNGYAIDYELYSHWVPIEGKLKIDFDSREGIQLNKYNGVGWEYNTQDNYADFSFAYTGDTAVGLQTLEIRIPWDAIGGRPSNFAIMAWVIDTGFRGNSPVDSVPFDPAVADNMTDPTNPWDEKYDLDTFTNLAEFEMFIPKPELTVSSNGPTVVGTNRTAEYNVTVQNLGSVDTQNVDIKVYLNGALYKNWSIDLPAQSQKILTFNWTPTIVGTYTIKAVVDEDNAIAEVNEDNNEFTMNVNVIWVGRIEVDGNPDDWTATAGAPNSLKVENGEAVWTDEIGDIRSDKNPYLPGKTSSHADLTEVRVTKDEKYIYFFFKFANMSNIKIGDNGATFIAVPIDFKEGGAKWLAGEMDMKSGLEWDIQFVINLKSNEYSGERKAVAVAGTDKMSLLYFVNPEGKLIPVDDALVGIDLDKDIVEVRIPLSIFNGAKEFRFQVATGFSYGVGVWNFGDSFNNDDISDAVDVITDNADTWEEVKDGWLEYYISVSFNNVIESVKVGDLHQLRTAEESKKKLDIFMQISKYYVPARVKNLQAEFHTLMKQFEFVRYPPEIQDKIKEYNMKAQEIIAEFNSTVNLTSTPYYTIGTAFKLFRLYIHLNKIIKELREIASVNYELMQNLTKKIDGSLDDWSLETLVYEDTTSFGQQGANLKALYVDYDDNFLYIALTTENKASWRVAYGFALDYKGGGYTGDTDAWGRKIKFTRGVDAQLYFWWFGEFFGEKGTDRIETMQLILWNGNGWKYYNLQDVGFVAWTGGANGLQTLEVAVPWDTIGGKPEKIAIVAWITGANAGDSAVETLPDDPTVHDLDPGQEWTDEDTINTFAEVAIS